MAKGRLSILLAFTLVVANIQCSEFCALGACYDGESASTPHSTSVPPCHQNHRGPVHHEPAPCSHQVIQAADATARVTLDIRAGELALLSAGTFSLIPPLTGV